MILDRTPLNFNEVQEILSKIPDNPKKEEITQFIDKFIKAKDEQAKKIKKELESSDILKIKSEHIVKIVDLLPKDISDLNKIFADVSLNEEEANKILDVVKSAK